MFNEEIHWRRVFYTEEDKVFLHITIPQQDLWGLGEYSRCGTNICRWKPFSCPYISQKPPQPKAEHYCLNLWADT